MCASEGAAAVGRTNDGKLAGKAMKDLCLATPSSFANVRFVLTDMDETLTYRGRLSARTYGALERLQRAGVSDPGDSRASGLVRSDGPNVAGGRRGQREWWPFYTERWWAWC